MTSVGEERRYNPRLGGEIASGDFAGYMKQPAARRIRSRSTSRCRPICAAAGRENETGLDAEPNWAQLTYTFAGIWEIQPHRLEEHRQPVQIVDVREPDEFNGPLGHIRGAKLIPLGELAERAGEIGDATSRSSRCAAPARAPRRPP